nr:MAG TPA: hypothetical protein [Caudoviricetes sp.]
MLRRLFFIYYFKERNFLNKLFIIFSTSFSIYFLNYKSNIK